MFQSYLMGKSIVRALIDIRIRLAYYNIDIRGARVFDSICNGNIDNWWARA